MAGLIKELYIDYSLNRLSLEEKSDLSVAVITAYRSGVLSGYDLRILDYYLQGYSAEEIAVKEIEVSTVIESILIRIFIILETVSGYTDERFIERIMSTKLYSRAKINALKTYVHTHGETFTHAKMD